MANKTINKDEILLIVLSGFITFVFIYVNKILGLCAFLGDSFLLFYYIKLLFNRFLCRFCLSKINYAPLLNNEGRVVKCFVEKCIVVRKYFFEKCLKIIEVIKKDFIDYKNGKIWDWNCLKDRSFYYM